MQIKFTFGRGVKYILNNHDHAYGLHSAAFRLNLEGSCYGRHSRTKPSFMTMFTAYEVL